MYQQGTNHNRVTEIGTGEGSCNGVSEFCGELLQGSQKAVRQ